MSLKNRFVSPPRDELENLRQPLTAGEKKVFDFFDEHLAPEWEIYIQPHLNGLRPDFVLLNPDVGIAVFEVKDWNLDAMHYWVEKRQNASPILLAQKDGTYFSLESDNPVRKVYQYKDEIFNLYCPRLSQGAGYAAITAGVIFPFADEARVKALFAPCLEYRNMDKAPAYSPISGREALGNGDIRAVFPESFRKFSHQMNENLVKDMRNWLIEPDASSTQRRPIELDRNQRSFVTSRTDSGYRRIRGAAGSGKSLILAARAAELLGQGKKVLVVTFNITLLHYLMDVAVRWPTSRGKTRSDITWLNFHQWCKRICQENDADKAYEDLWVGASPEYVLNEALPALVNDVLHSGQVSPVYDAVLVDEGQDFRPGWWDVLRKVCNPGGEMLLVADVTQDIYGTASAWTDEAMIGAGFSGRWAELDISYRMPKLALEIAAKFAEKYLPEAARILPKNDQIGLALERCELRWVQVLPENSALICRDEILRLFPTDDHQNYSFADATFLCNSRALGYEVVKQLGQKGIRCVHTYDSNDQESRRQKVGFYMGDAKVKATTLHSFKGWESRSLVIYMGQKATPQSLALLYTGLTRIKRHPEGSSLTVVSSSTELSEYGKTWPEFETIY
ncbi:NERD domain-containing protein [Pseudomonas helleri]|uniref:AAA family ATPase n=1 Tax=Pseudomonas helleri TaxID=1608996 RepID=A0A7X2C5K5_9PSED|nr:NERD domain-containing protein [Pseudomonas helleri]MQT91956.1 AAA family ATPase [Pseudomonas helleri]